MLKVTNFMGNCKVPQFPFSGWNLWDVDDLHQLSVLQNTRLLSELSPLVGTAPSRHPQKIKLSVQFVFNTGFTV